MTVSEPKGETTSAGSIMPKSIISSEPKTAVSPAGRFCLTNEIRIIMNIADARIGFIICTSTLITWSREGSSTAEAG